MRHRSRSVLVAFLLVSLTSVVGAEPFAYVTNSDSGSVTVIDTATNAVVGAPITVGVGTSPKPNPHGVAVSHDGKRVYVANQGQRSVSVIDAATRTVLATITVGDLPYGVAVNPAGTRAYVTNSGNHSVSVIDTATNTVIAGPGSSPFVPLPVGISPKGVDVSPDGARVYVANSWGAPTVSVIDAATNTVAASVDVGFGAAGVAVSPNGARLYVTMPHDEFAPADAPVNALLVISTATNTVMTRVPLPVVPVPGTVSDPAGVTVNPAGTRVYVANMGSGSVSVIDAATNTGMSDIVVPGTPFGVAMGFDGQRAYVALFDTQQVAVINIADNTVMATIPVGSFPVAFGRFIQPPPPASVQPPPVSRYRFVGFFPPIRNPNLNVARAGSRVVLRWLLLDASGNPITAMSAVTSRQYGTIPCGDGRATAVPTDVTTADGELRVITRELRKQGSGDDGDDDDDDKQGAAKRRAERIGRLGYYRFTWQTERSWDNQCRRFILKLDDGTVHTVDFRFR